MKTTAEIIAFLEIQVRDFAGLAASEPIDPNENIQHKYQYDSLDAVELIMKCEKEYSITIPDSVSATLFTINEFADVIEKQIAIDKPIG